MNETIPAQLPPPLSTETASFPDRITASALATTLELLKFAGGVTLSTTDKFIMQPSLAVTRNLLLPNLMAAVIDYLQTHTPQRAKDWFRILSTSVQQLVTIILLGNDPEIHHASILFRQRFWIVLVDWLDCLSSPTARQYYIDATSTLVQWFQAWHTPEMQRFLQQAAVTTTRFLEVAASARTQRLVHDLQDCTWQWIELLADPVTTTALAEVTAYWCHALEMEDAHIYDDSDSENRKVSQPSPVALDPRHGTAATKAQRRRDRQRQQQRIYLDHPLITTHPEATVEQVILSSLGIVSPSSGGAGGDKKGQGKITEAMRNAATFVSDVRDDSSRNVGLGKKPSTVRPSTTSASASALTSAVASTNKTITTTSGGYADEEHEDNDETTTLGDEEENGGQEDNEDDNKDEALKQTKTEIPHELAWHERARNGVDIDYLREQIRQYAKQQQSAAVSQEPNRRRHHHHPGDVQVETVFEDEEEEAEEEEQAETTDERAKLDDDLEDLGFSVGSSVPSSSKRTRPVAKLVFPASENEEPLSDEKKEKQLVSLLPKVKAQRRPGESSVDHFYRILDELLRQRRQDSLKWAIETNQNRTATEAAMRPKKIGSVRPIYGSRGGARSLKETWRELQAAMEQERNEARQHDRKNLETSILQNRRIAYFGLMLISVLGLVWTGLGCYGIYVLCRQSPSLITTDESPSWTWLGLGKTTAAGSSSGSQEIVIRIVREVVHVNPNGEVISSPVGTGAQALSSGSNTFSQKEVDKLAECVAKTLN